MKKIIIVALCSFLLHFSVHTVNAALLLGSKHTGLSGGSSVVLKPADLSISIYINNPSPNAILFDVPFAIGSYSLSSGPEFTQGSANLTNNVDDYVWDKVSRSSPTFNRITGLKESLFFGHTPDFYGNTIEEIAFSVDSVFLDSPGSDPGNNGIWTDFAFEGTLNIYGSRVPSEVPEPSTLLLLGSGLLGLAAFRQRKRAN